MAAASALVQAVTAELAKYPTLDPRAVLAVAAQEGLGGGIGDGGHAYGPFQLNNAGGVITGSHPGTYDPGIQSWATSPAGIDFALQQIQAVAGGLKGAPAVENIVSRFERPANIPGETSRALAAYGLPPQTGGSAVAPMAPTHPGRASEARSPFTPAAAPSVSPLARAAVAPPVGQGFRQALSLLGF